MHDVREIKALHRQAMERSDSALAAQLRGEAGQALTYFREAYDLESEAACSLAHDLEAEPTRSILLRSAATLALDANLFAQAEKLIYTALSGDPPAEIAEELRNLLEQVSFQRHLDLRGITLGDEEIQMSIAGEDVGYGIAPTDIFIARVEQTENLLYRTAERKQEKPYRDRGRRDKSLQQNLELYMTVPRAASFAVTFKVGRSTQLSLPGQSFGMQVIDELFECLEILSRGDEARLKERIADEAYYRNFVGLARLIAPDGQRVSLVGFTTSRLGSVKTVALRAQEGNHLLLPTARLTQPTSRTVTSAVQLSGILKMANALHEGKHKIEIVAEGNMRHTIDVPSGMMSDIVKPLWDTHVIVTGEQRGKKITLQDIRPLGIPALGSH